LQADTTCQLAKSCYHKLSHVATKDALLKSCYQTSAAQVWLRKTRAAKAAKDSRCQSQSCATQVALPLFRGIFARLWMFWNIHKVVGCFPRVSGPEWGRAARLGLGWLKNAKNRRENRIWWNTMCDEREMTCACAWKAADRRNYALAHTVLARRTPRRTRPGAHQQLCRRKRILRPCLVFRRLVCVSVEGVWRQGV